MKLLLLCLICLCHISAFADTALSIGFNNPSYTDTGLNLLVMNDKWSYEIGFGKPNVGSYDDNAYGNVVGDFDIKYHFNRPIGIYVETGIRTFYDLAGGAEPRFSFAASSPFFGFGLAYINKILLYASIDYNLNFGELYTAVGFGIFL